MSSFDSDDTDDGDGDEDADEDFDGTHDAKSVGWDGHKQERLLICECGFIARGENWSEAGESLDDHMEDEI